MELLAGWEPKLRGITLKPEPPSRPPTPKAAVYYARQVTYVADVAAVDSLIQLARELPLARVGIDTEFRYARPGVVIDRHHTANDCRSVEPLLLSLALVGVVPH